MHSGELPVAVLHSIREESVQGLLGGIVQRGVSVTEFYMMNSGRMKALTGVVVASTAGPTRIMLICTMKMARQLDSDDKFYNAFTRCSLRVTGSDV
jgi:hypothetical protein